MIKAGEESGNLVDPQNTSRVQMEQGSSNLIKNQGAYDFYRQSWWQWCLLIGIDDDLCNSSYNWMYLKVGTRSCQQRHSSS